MATVHEHQCRLIAEEIDQRFFVEGTSRLLIFFPMIKQMFLQERSDIVRERFFAVKHSFKVGQRKRLSVPDRQQYCKCSGQRSELRLNRVPTRHINERLNDLCLVGCLHGT